MFSSKRAVTGRLENIYLSIALRALIDIMPQIFEPFVEYFISSIPKLGYYLSTLNSSFS